MAPPSRSNLVSCWKCQHTTELPQCAQCRTVQPLPERYDYFAVLGLEPRLRVTSEELHSAFLARSRALHPDHFVSAASPEPAYALQWSTAVNRSYQALRDRNQRTRYVLDLNNSRPAAKPAVPLELAETYFELQDTLEANGNKEELQRFQTELTDKRRDLDQKWERLAAALDEKSPTALSQLEAWLIDQKYLSSMLSDIESKL